MAKTAPINQSSFKPRKTGAVRLEGQLTSGDASTSRGASARGGTLASSKGDGSNSATGTYKASYSEGGLGKMPQKFRPTTKGGKVK